MKVKLERSWNGVLRRVWPRGCGVGGPVAVENVLVKRSEKFWSTENSIRVLAGVFESSKALKMLPLKFWKGPRRSFESFGALKIISLNLRHSERLWNVENLSVLAEVLESSRPLKRISLKLSRSVKKKKRIWRSPCGSIEKADAEVSRSSSWFLDMSLTKFS